MFIKDNRETKNEQNIDEAYRRIAINYLFSIGICPTLKRVIQAVDVIICNRRLGDTPKDILNKFYGNEYKTLIENEKKGIFDIE